MSLRQWRSKGAYLAKIQPAPPEWCGDTCDHCGKKAPWTLAEYQPGIEGFKPVKAWYSICYECHEAMDAMRALGGA